MKKVIWGLLLALSLSVSAFAMEVPTDTIVQNLNGSQQVIQTYTLAPETNPAVLIEDPFELEGYLYTFSNIIKTENHMSDTKLHTEVITVETEEKDLDVVLEQLTPTISYDDGQYSGTLALDHTSIVTEATGYTTKSYTVTETKTLGNLDRNDMSYVPSTTVKNGVTLKLTNVEWQVTGTELVGETLVPSSYQAIATYSGKAYYTAADGYITTAEYVGEVTKEGIESITYRVTYLGTVIVQEEVQEEVENSIPDMIKDWFFSGWPFLVIGCLCIGQIVLALLLARAHKQLRQLTSRSDELQEAEYEEMEDTTE